MNCIADSVLRERNDGELGELETSGVDRHLRTCPGCQRRLEAIAARAAGTARLLDMLAPADAEPVDAAAAYARLRGALNARDASTFSWRDRLAAWRRPLWGAIAAAAVIVAFGFTPASIVAQKFLDMLRVQKIAVVPVSEDTFLPDNGQVGQLLAKAIADSVVVTMKPGSPQTEPDMATAGRVAGFTTRTPSAAGAVQKVLVTDETAFQMTLNRERITDLLQQAGQTQVAVPDFADGSIIAVHIPRGVISDYGDCPAQSSDSRKSLLPGCVVLVQTPSPTVSVPPNLNLQALAEAGLQVAGLSAAEAQAFCQNVDWTSTLVIPIPRNSSSYRTVSVDGVNGTLIEVLPRHENPGWYSLVWVKNGVVYSLNGGGSSAAATSIAESLD